MPTFAIYAQVVVFTSCENTQKERDRDRERKREREGGGGGDHVYAQVVV